MNPIKKIKILPVKNFFKITWKTMILSYSIYFFDKTNKIKCDCDECDIKFEIVKFQKLLSSQKESEIDIKESVRILKNLKIKDTNCLKKPVI